MIRRGWILLLCCVLLLTACGTPAASQVEEPTNTRVIPTEVPTATPRPTRTPIPPTMTATPAPTRVRQSPTATLAPSMPPTPTVAKLGTKQTVFDGSGSCQLGLPEGFTSAGEGTDTWVSSDRYVFIGLELIRSTPPIGIDEATTLGLNAVKQVVGGLEETGRTKSLDTRRITFSGSVGASRGWGTFYIRQFGQDYCQVTVISAQGTTLQTDVVVETVISNLTVRQYRPNPVNYLALGDSYALGTGASDPATKGYAGLFAASMRTNGRTANFTNQAVSGATSADFLGDFPTAGPAGKSPLANAVRILNEGGASVVTLDIGGNDILGLLKPGQPCEEKKIETDACFQAMREALREVTTPNLTPIVAALVEAAPAGAQIIVLTYPNPFSVGKLTTAEERTDAAMAELNILITNAVRVNQPKAVERGVTLTLVDLAPIFKGEADTLTNIVATPADIHPNDAGHAAIAEAIKKVYRPR